MLIKLDNLTDDGDGPMVLVTCSDAREAKLDQCIMGSRWESDGPDFAYAIICDRPGLIERLESEGYEVWADEYCPMDASDRAETVKP